MWSYELTIVIFRIPVAKVNLLVYQMQLQYCNLSSLIGYVGILETSQIRNNWKTNCAGPYALAYVYRSGWILYKNMCRSDFYKNLDVLGIYFPVTQKNPQLISGSALHMPEVTFTLYILVSQVHNFSSAADEKSWTWICWFPKLLFWKPADSCC